MKHKSIFYLSIALVIINAVTHFLPPERASLAPDDYVFLEEVKSTELSQILALIPRVSDRPLHYFVSMSQAKIIGDNPEIMFILLILSTSSVLLLVFWLFNLLFKDVFLAFIGSMIYCLLPNKLEIYHTSNYFSINLAIGVTVLSLVYFIIFVKNGKIMHLILSLLTYLVAVFWYGVGIFMPLIMAVYCYLETRKIRKVIFYYAIIFAVYALYRFTNAFGIANLQFEGYRINLSLFPLTPLKDLFHHYLGRYMLRNIIYGLYKFFTMENPWQWLIVLLNLILLASLVLHIKNRKLERVDTRLLIFGVSTFMVFLIPFFLNKDFGIASRYLALPSIGVAISFVWLLSFLKKSWKSLLFLFILIALFICQGNAWIQVIASRINAAIYATMKEMKERLSEADNVIIDVKSLADNIPFTLVKRDFNIFDTYYGALAFHQAGVAAMVEWLTNSKGKSIYFATKSPRVIKGELLEFAISEHAGYRVVSRKSVILPQTKSIVVDFRKIFGESFHNGLRKDRLR